MFTRCTNPIEVPCVARRNSEAYTINGGRTKFLSCGNMDKTRQAVYEGWNFNSGNYLFTTDTK